MLCRENIDKEPTTVVIGGLAIVNVFGRFLMVMALTLPLGAQAAVHLLYTTSVKTARGSLTVQPYFKGRAIDWSTFQRDGEANEFRVTLNGHLVTTFSPREWEGVYFEAAYPSPKNAHLVLIALWPGGNSCNGYFAVIEVPDHGKPIVSDQFGNCLDVAFTDAYKISKNPVYRDGAWYIGLEGTNPAVKFGIEWWVYRDGRVKQAGGQDPEAAKWPPEQRRYYFQLQMRLSKEERERLIKQYGNPKDAYYAWLMGQAKKVDPAKFR